MTRLMSKQKIRLFELIEEHYHVLSGNPNRGNEEKAVIWEEIKNILNELGPPKTTEKWRRVWTDIRKTLKKKVSLRKTHEMNGSKIPDEYIYSESDLWVIRICGMDAIEKSTKQIKKEVTEIEDSESSNVRLAAPKHIRSSQRVNNRKTSKKETISDELIDDRNLLCPVLVFSDDKATQCSESQADLSPTTKKPRISLNNKTADSEEDFCPESEDNNKNQLKQLVYLQRKQLAVTRQIYERQKCHNADQRQFNARVTNLLEEILQQLKTNQKT